jgi:hypothetical protein
MIREGRCSVISHMHMCELHNRPPGFRGTPQRATCDPFAFGRRHHRGVSARRDTPTDKLLLEGAIVPRLNAFTTGAVVPAPAGIC